MTIIEIIEQTTAGGFVACLVILLSLIEITPIKLSPLHWIGKRINASVDAKLEEMEKKSDRIEGKLDNHVAETDREIILDYRNSTMHGRTHTEEEWKRILKVCTRYENHIHDNNLENGEADEAINYLRIKYRDILANGGKDFLVEFKRG